jgi:aquaporin Z
VGGILGVLVASMILRGWLAHPDVRFAVTVPRPGEVWTPFLSELGISFVMMSVVLAMSSSRYQGWTGIAAGLLVATYIAFEAPLSGMSMNPARSLGSALPAGIWDSLWIYFVAPPLGMLLATQVWGARRATGCAKVVHMPDARCIHCGFEPRPYDAIGQAQTS